MRIANDVSAAAGPSLDAAVKSYRERKAAPQKQDPACLPPANNCVERTAGGCQVAMPLSERQFIYVVAHEVLLADIRVVSTIETSISVVGRYGTRWVRTHVQHFGPAKLALEREPCLQAATG